MTTSPEALLAAALYAAKTGYDGREGLAWDESDEAQARGALATDPGRELLRRATERISVEALPSLVEQLRIDAARLAGYATADHPEDHDCDICRAANRIADAVLAIEAGCAAALPSPDPEPACCDEAHREGVVAASEGLLIAFRRFCQRRGMTLTDDDLRGVLAEATDLADPEPVEESR